MSPTLAPDPVPPPAGYSAHKAAEYHFLAHQRYIDGRGAVRCRDTWPHLMLTWPVFSYLAILTFSMGNTQTCSRCLTKTRHQLCIFTYWSRYWHMFTLFCRCNQLVKKHPNFTTCLTRKPNTKRTNWNFYPVVVQIRWAKLEETFSLLSNSLQ